MIRGIRGAITVQIDNEEEIISATERLAREVIRENGITAESVSSVFISVTHDLTSGFPAKALRQIDGWTFVPVMCMQEIPVPGSLQKCIRLMFHVNTDVRQEGIKHIYLEGAKVLRPDLFKS
ncbi:chorismate mutase [Mesobacillus persicus]|uniref:chorismate mutase n=1 Tax=Mesobacillus persicus TaxID=930146 RepID=A0A1H8BPX1_9BACI|nr:chorismate mutase [Mesobacillus persicus]SEM84895.1 chorismate mutase [Mesobacillus persicus]